MQCFSFQSKFESASLHYAYCDHRYFALTLTGHHGHPSSHHPAMAAAVAAAGLHPDTDTDPRELEAFAERFKQRRIKLGSYSINYFCVSRSCISSYTYLHPLGVCFTFLFSFSCFFFSVSLSLFHLSLLSSLLPSSFESRCHTSGRRKSFSQFKIARSRSLITKYHM